MDYSYQIDSQYFAQIAGGLEEMGAEELAGLGAKDVRPGWRGIHFNASKEVLYRVNYESRLSTRVLAPLCTFDCHSDRYLYSQIQEIDWSDWMGPDGTFAVFANVSNSKITHSQYAALRIKDAIVDQFRKKTGVRPSIDRRNPDVWINLHLHANRAIVSIDASGGSLHRRGYRSESLEAPMQETVAAAIIRMTEWDGSRPLIDPMCGTGTILSEALMSVANIPAGHFRESFGFERFPDFDKQAWERVKTEADKKIREIPVGLISGSDKSADAVRASQTSIRRIPSGRNVLIERKPYASIDGIDNSVIVCNPPYGVRMGGTDDLSVFYRNLGDFLKQKCTGSTAFIYFGERVNLKYIGLRPVWKKPLISGSLDGRLARFELY